MRLDRGLPNGREGLDRGLSKGREDLTERQQQTHMSMGGTPGRLTGRDTRPGTTLFSNTACVYQPVSCIVVHRSAWRQL